MAFVLRFVQRFRPADRAAFMELEAQFAAIERDGSGFPKGRRLQPYSGREQSSTLIWESEFPTLAAAEEGLTRIQGHPEHERLFQKQVPYMTEAYTEIYEVLDFSEGHFSEGH